MRLNELKGIHRVVKVLARGDVRKYHYAYRGGPQFWSSESPFKVGSAEYIHAFLEASKPQRFKAPSNSGSEIQTGDILDGYRKSVHYVSLAARTQSDYDKYLRSFESEFGMDPIKLFEEKESLSEIREWKEQWAHSPKQYDYATSVITRFLNWARDEDAAIVTHHHMNVARIYKSDRSEIIWLPDELQALLSVASEKEERVVVAASEGGLTPQDIGILKREHVQKTPNGRRLFFKRTKSGKPVSIPVTPALGRLIDETPLHQEFLIVSLEGHPLKPERASGIIRELKQRANKLAAQDQSRIHIRDELRLYDMRGTAATELLRAGCSLNEIAVTMGWGLRHAANIIEKYAALVPEVADEVLEKLTVARQKKIKGVRYR